jgi:hypothetical protein
MRGTSRRNLEMFEQLCGDDALRNVILTTTHWDLVSEEVGSKRGAQLESQFWEPMTRHGSRVARFQPATYESAWDLIDRFETRAESSNIPDVPPPLKLQTEIVDDGKQLHQTSAFLVLVKWWAQVIEKLKGILRKQETQVVHQELKHAMKEKKTLDDSGSVRSSIMSSSSRSSSLFRRDSGRRRRVK